MTNTIVLLTYMNRSGSTLLARLLDEYRDIEVSLEGDVPDGILVPWVNTSSKNDIPTLVAKLRSRTKLHYWNLDFEKLEGRLESMVPSLTPEVLIKELLKMHFNDSPAPVYVFKRGKYIEAAEMAHNVLGGIKILFVMRDLHAIYYSYKRTRGSLSGKPMGANPVTVALEYRRVMNQVRSHFEKEWLKVVRYERLVSRPAEEVEEVLSFLDISNRHRKVSRYAAAIPKEQKHLHEKISQAPDPRHIEAWREHLSLPEIFCLRAIAEKQLHWAGYPFRARSVWRCGPVFLCYHISHWIGVFGRLSGLGGISQARVIWGKLAGLANRCCAGGKGPLR